MFTTETTSFFIYTHCTNFGETAIKTQPIQRSSNSIYLFRGFTVNLNPSKFDYTNSYYLLLHRKVFFRIRLLESKEAHYRSNDIEL